MSGGPGAEMHALLRRLFPICRSLTGAGVRETLAILREHIPLEIREVPSGTQAFDWTVPDEWNIRDAYIKDSKGRRVVDFRESNLHVLGYSVPFQGRMRLAELKEHLITLPEQPRVIPYVTSYYKRHWGFCVPHELYERLPEDDYEVLIDSTLEPGSLTYAELVIGGHGDRELLFSTNICHPSLANNELSGPVLATFLAKRLLAGPKPRFTCRFLFIPETIGAIVYLSRHKDRLREKVVAGYTLTCVGDPGSFSYLKSRRGDALVDRVSLHVLRSRGPHAVYDFLERGSDERQYCAPGIDLPVGQLMRTKYGKFPEYHTSADDMDFVTPEALAGSLDVYEECVRALEANRVYAGTVLCEPQMGKRGLYPTLSEKGKMGLDVKAMMDILAYCDGETDLMGVAERIGRPLMQLAPLALTLVDSGLLVERPAAA